MACPLCKYLLVDSLDRRYIHQVNCLDYTGGVDADKARELLKGVEIGWWNDQVLEVFPKATWVQDPLIQYSAGDKSVVITTYYDGFQLVIARGKTHSSAFGDIEVYAVQRIDFHDRDEG